MPVRPRRGRGGAPRLLAAASDAELRAMAVRVPAAVVELRRRGLLGQALGSSASMRGVLNGGH